MNPRRVAVIDVGTNSTNLLITDEQRNPVERVITSTRLGQQLFATGKLDDAAIERTVQVICSYVEQCRNSDVSDIRIVGTAACRRASNTSALRDRVEKETGYSLTVLTEKDEAKLSFEGALIGLPQHDGMTVVIDIGGGSTEFAAGVLEPELFASLQHGAVTVTDRELHSDPPRPEELTNAIGLVTDDVEELTRSFPALLGSSRFVGVAGTIVTVAAVELGLMQFDSSALHGFVLTREAAEDVFRTLATESFDERIHNPGLSRDRADIIVAGCCILVGIMRRLFLSEIIVSTTGLPDGVARRDTMDL